MAIQNDIWELRHTDPNKPGVISSLPNCGYPEETLQSIMGRGGYSLYKNGVKVASAKRPKQRT